MPVITRRTLIHLVGAAASTTFTGRNGRIASASTPRPRHRKLRQQRSPFSRTEARSSGSAAIRPRKGQSAGGRRRWSRGKRFPFD